MLAVDDELVGFNKFGGADCFDSSLGGDSAASYSVEFCHVVPLGSVCFASMS